MVYHSLSSFLRHQDGRVAQLGEHLLCKQGVAGSNPVTSTNLILALTIIYAAFSVAVLRCDFGTIGTTEATSGPGRVTPYPTRSASSRRN